MKGKKKSGNCCEKSFLQYDVREYKSVLLDHVANADRYGTVEHQPGVAECVKLAVLATRIDVGRQVCEKCEIERSARE